jgi:23S rRNA pseudouridine2604 synthase
MATTIKLPPFGRRTAPNPSRKPVRAVTAPRVHQGQGPKIKPEDDPDARPRPRPQRVDPNAPIPVQPSRLGLTRTVDPSRPARPAPSATAKATDVAVSNPGEERISKRLATLGLASRREADAWIEAGWVRVNGRVAVLGERVAADAIIHIDDRARDHQITKVTILLHKPLDVVSGQAEDNHIDAATLIKRSTRWEGDTSDRRFESAHATGLAPAGRLDLDSTGLLVLTQDGRIAKQLIGEQSEVEKEYIVHVDWRDPWAWSEQALERLRFGITLDDVDLQPAIVERLRTQDTNGVLRMVLREGRKRQIRRMCELVGLRVTQLVRVRIGRIRLADLPLGQWRYLQDGETF